MTEEQKIALDKYQAIANSNGWTVGGIYFDEGEIKISSLHLLL